jgi:KaiC/GvpD/RAD55 family RecA-like ATPase
MIPKQLQNNNFRFILIGAKTKKPIEQAWTLNTDEYDKQEDGSWKHKVTGEFYQVRSTDGNTQNYKGELTNYTFNNEKLLTHIKNGGNYGVMGGLGGLVILDIDDSSINEELDKLISQTFTVKTGSGNQHRYFIAPKDTKKLILQVGTKHFGELQSWGAQVVGPDSIHPNGNKYEIIQDIEIANLYETKINILKQKYSDNYEIIVQPKWENIVKLDIADQIKITSLINVANLKKYRNEYFGKHPVHGSETGMNFFVNPDKNLCYCFRHKIGYDSLGMLAINEGLIQCGEKLRGKTFIKALEIAKTKYNIKLSEDDTKKIFNRSIFKDDDIDPYSMYEMQDELEIVCDKDINTLEIKEIEWLVQDYIPRNSLTIIAGKSGSFKSTLALHMAYSIAENKKVFDTMQTIQAKVLYLNEENAWNIFRPTLIRVKNGLEIENSDNLFFATYQNLRLDTEAGIKKLQKVIEKHNIEVIVLDSLKRFIGFEENAADAVNKFYIDIIKPLMIKYKLTTIMLHHAKKDIIGEASNKLDQLRGSSDFVNICDCILFTKRIPGLDWFYLEQIKNRAKMEVDKKKIQIVDIDGGSYFIENDASERNIEGEMTRCSLAIIEYLKSHPDINIIKRKEMIEATGQQRTSIQNSFAELKDAKIIEELELTIPSTENITSFGKYKVNRKHDAFLNKNSSNTQQLL